MADLVLVTVDGTGRPVARVGTWSWDGDAITATGDTATSILAGLRLRSRWPDDRLWRLLQAEGWSNGQLATVAPEQAADLPDPDPAPAVATPPQQPDTADPAGDKARQRLRRLEREVRKKRLAAKLALTDEARAAAKRRVRELQTQIREHCEATGVTRQRYREQLYLDLQPPLT